MARIDAFLRIGHEQDCSDIHLTVGMSPLVRLDGELIPLKYRELSESETESLIREILTEASTNDLETMGAADFSYEVEGLGRFRMNVVNQLRGFSIVCRIISTNPPSLASLGLPSVLTSITKTRSGLMLVTGPAGTGKSTTLAALIDAINEEQSVNIITLEDPIEFVHVNKNSLIVQRELGTHMTSFSSGLRAALREDPDVILVGELRDSETIGLAIEAAETGHLVFGTLHTRGAYPTIHRVVDAFPADSQSQIRHTLAETLKCVLSQSLIGLADGRGRRAVTEILMVTPAVAQLIREGKTFQIPQVMATGRRHGMHLMDQSLLKLVEAKEIDPDEAFLKATDKREFVRFVQDPNLLNLLDDAGVVGA